jgi:hypothetical protein
VKLALSIKELQKESGLGRTFLYQAIQRGELQSLRAGSRRLVLGSDAEKFLESLRVAIPEEKTSKDGCVCTLAGSPRNRPIVGGQNEPTRR